MSGPLTLSLYCEHVSTSHINCNRYTTVHIDVDETPADAIAEMDWALVDGEVLCEEHAHDDTTTDL